MPLLKRKAKYQIITKAIIAPENSVQIQLDFFDVKNEIIDGPLTIDLDGEFEVPEEMDHYQLSLVNLNNRSLVVRRFNNQTSRKVLLRLQRLMAI